MARLELYSKRDGHVQMQGGLNWGFSDGHVCKDDAYIAITKSFIKNNPNFFPAAGSIINVKWDDGKSMLCSVEGTQKVEGKIYPKQLTSAYDKSIFGEYIRLRMGLSLGTRITMDDLDSYGRRDIEIQCLENNTYEIDFSV